MEARCYLTKKSNGEYYIGCYAKLHYILFGRSKTTTIYSFERLIRIKWNWSKTYEGKWSAGISIPLPPPVSFITVRLNVRIGYKIYISLDARPTSTLYPFRYRARAII